MRVEPHEDRHRSELVDHDRGIHDRGVHGWLHHDHLAAVENREHVDDVHRPDHDLIRSHYDGRAGDVSQPVSQHRLRDR